MTITTEPIYRQTWGIPITAPRTCHVYHHDVVLPPRHATRALSTAADLVRETTAHAEHLIVHMSAQAAQSRSDPARGRLQVTVRHVSDSPAALAAMMMGIDPETAPLPSGEGRDGRTQQAVSLDHVLGWAVAGFRRGVEVDALDDFVASILAASPDSQVRTAARRIPVDEPVVGAVWLHLVRRGVDTGAHWVVEDDLPNVMEIVKEALGSAFVVDLHPHVGPPLGTLDEPLAVIGRVTEAAGYRALRTAEGHLVTGTKRLGAATHLGRVGDIACVTGVVVEHVDTPWGLETRLEAMRPLA